VADAKQIMEQAASLPLEERALRVDRLLRALNPSDAAVDRKWAGLAQRRLDEIRHGRVTPVPIEEALDEAARSAC
jgi:hypothetical protein